jgi:hypothetical protein
LILASSFATSTGRNSLPGNAGARIVFFGRQAHPAGAAAEPRSKHSSGAATLPGTPFIVWTVTSPGRVEARGTSSLSLTDLRGRCMRRGGLAEKAKDGRPRKATVFPNAPIHEPITVASAPELVYAVVSY